MPSPAAILASRPAAGPSRQQPDSAARDLLVGRMLNACFDRIGAGGRRRAGRAAAVGGLTRLAALMELVPGPGAAPAAPAGPGLPPAGQELPAIPGYRIEAEIGRGGMGVVYRAVQQSTRRVVALKVMLEGALASAAARRRFEREVELAAALKHPHVVTVFESGLARGRYYLAMEYVAGRRLDEYLLAHRCSARQILALFLKICDAVGFAHQKGVIHRDLKPSNILVDTSGQPRILDFGLAKATRGALAGESRSQELSLSGQLIGTVAYLSPEQAEGRLHDVDTRSDIYALGVVLYQALTGRMPYDTGGGLAEALRRIREDVPVAPARLDPRLDADVSAIVLKALAKPREQRYQSVAELAADIRRYFRGECVQARAASGLYVWRKALRRYRTQCLAGAALLALLTLFSGVVGALYLRVRSESSRRAAALREAETLAGRLAQQSRRLEAELHQSNVWRGVAHLMGNEPFQAEGVLWREHLRRADSLSTWALRCYYHWNPVAAAHYGTGWTYALCYLPGGRYLVAGTKRGPLVVWDTQSWQRVAELRGHAGRVCALDVSPDGRLVASGSQDGTVRLWETAAWRALAVLEGHDGEVNALSFAPDGCRLASAGADGTVRIWRTAPAATGVTVLAGHAGGAEAVRFSPDGKRLASGGRDGCLRLWDAAAGILIRSVPAAAGRVLALRFTPDGGSLAAGVDDGVALYDLRAARWRWRHAAHVRWTLALDFSPDGTRLASSGWGAVVHLWDVASGRRCDTFRGNPNAVWSIAFSPTGRLLAAGCIGEIRLWDVSRGLDVRVQRPAGVGKRLVVAWDRQSGALATAGWSDGRLRFFRRGAAESCPAPPGLLDLCLSPDGRSFATADARSTVTVYDRLSRRVLASVATGQGGVACVRYLPDGRGLLAAGADGTLVALQLPALTESARWPAHEGRVLTLAVSRDGRWIVSGGTDWLAKLWRRGARVPAATWRHKEWVTCAAFAPDGRLVATGSADCTVALRQLASGVMHRLPLEHAHWVNAVCFAPDGGLLFSGSNDHTVRVWNLRRFMAVATLPSEVGAVHSLDLSPDGQTLAVGGAAGMTQIDLAVTTERIQSNRQYALRRYAPRQRSLAKP